MSAAPHVPVLLEEVIAALDPRPGDVVIDATFGAGGYTRALLDRGATVHAFDRDPDAIAGMITFVTERWRMTVYEGTVWGELYDLDNDPDEIVNLWDEPDHAGVRDQLNQSLIYELLALRDRSMSPTGQG